MAPEDLRCAHGVPMENFCAFCAGHKDPNGRRLRELERENDRLRRHFDIAATNALVAETEAAELRGRLERLIGPAVRVVGIYESRLDTDDDLLDQLKAPMADLDSALSLAIFQSESAS